MQGLPELGLANILPLKHFRNVGLDQPPPPQLEFWTDFGTLDLSWSGQPSPPMKIWTDLGILKLSWYGLHPLPSKNENLDRSWHLGSELVWSTPPNLCGSWCAETNRCIPQGYSLCYYH